MFVILFHDGENLIIKGPFPTIDMAEHLAASIKNQSANKIMMLVDPDGRRRRQSRARPRGALSERLPFPGSAS